MKLIVAIIWPDKLEAVQAVLDEPDARLMSVSDVGGGRALTEIYRGAEMQVLQPRRRLEIVVLNDAVVRDTVEKIARAASLDNSTRLGGGDIMVLELDDCVSVPGGNCDQQSARQLPNRIFAAFPALVAWDLGRKLLYSVLGLGLIGVSAYYLLQA